MQIFATFDHSVYLELVIKKLEQNEVNDIFAVPLDHCNEDPQLFDTMHQSDGVSLINKGMFLAVIFSVIGASRGFILEWGPIYWGLIGAGGGFLLGFIIDYLLLKLKNKNKKAPKGKKSEVILIIECKDEVREKVEKVLWEHSALGVAKVRGEGSKP